MLVPTKGILHYVVLEFSIIFLIAFTDGTVCTSKPWYMHMCGIPGLRTASGNQLFSYSTLFQGQNSGLEAGVLVH